MKKIGLLLLWLTVLALGAFLRFEQLDLRPFHADEATGARITAHRMESKGYVFDPLHYHGPTLSLFGELHSRLLSQTSWASLEKKTLRWIPALAGCALLVVPTLGIRRFGHASMLVTALLLTTSPLLIYYSRMYIHEMLLAFFGLLALVQIAQRHRAWLLGIWIGLMFSTKETFAISMIAWSAAATAVFLLHLQTTRTKPTRIELLTFAREATLCLVLASAVSLAFYTNGFTRWQGAVDAIRTYFVYETVEGHDKPATYYLQLLLQPRKLAGYWWFETPVALLALVALGTALRRGDLKPWVRNSVFFLSLASLFHLLIYSAIGYKTPWLMVLPWVHVCALAGFAFASFPSWSPRSRVLALLALLVISASQLLQSRQATGHLASDDRNPYAYVPTSDDIETLEAWLDSINAALPELALEPIGVVGADYWPLPWYLRHQGPTGFWPTAPPNLERLPLVFATEDLSDSLTDSHTPIPRGLRTDTPITAWVRDDFWYASLDVPEP